MTIKEVEKLTGLTAKTIRYYEKEGLLQVKRDNHNSYRNYSEEDVLLLKKIRLFRYLDFSVAEIKPLLLMRDEEIAEQLLNQAERLQEKSEKNQDKKDLCLALSKDLQRNSADPDEYGDIIDFYEDDDTQLLMKDLAAPSLLGLIYIILICIAPVLWLFIHIEEQRWDMLPLTAALALMATAALTLACRNYWDWRKHRNNALKRKNKESRKEMKRVVPGVLSGLIIMLLTVIIIGYLVESLLAPRGWLFYENQSPDILISLLMLLAAVFFSNFINTLICKEKSNVKISVSCLLILLAGVYLCATNIIFVTDDSITRYSPMNLKGKTYGYDEVTKVDARFGSRRIALNEHEKRGSFQYAIFLDGKKYVFSVPTVNPDIKRYQEDTYLELEDFDKALMALDIPKTSDDANSEHCDFDERYRDRFLRIIKLRGTDE